MTDIITKAIFLGNFKIVVKLNVHNSEDRVLEIYDKKNNSVFKTNKHYSISYDKKTKRIRIYCENILAWDSKEKIKKEIK